MKFPGCVKCRLCGGLIELRSVFGGVENVRGRSSVTAKFWSAVMYVAIRVRGKVGNGMDSSTHRL